MLNFENTQTVNAFADNGLIYGCKLFKC